MTTLDLLEAPIVVEEDTVEVEFFATVLGLDYDNVYICEAAHLSDFALSSTPPGVDMANATLPELFDAWDAWALPTIKEHFGVELQSTNISFAELFDQIERARAKKAK